MRFVFLLLACSALLSWTSWPALADTAPPNLVLFQVDFTKAKDNGRLWLSSNGFSLAKDMSMGGRGISLTGDKNDRGLRVHTSRPSFGLAIKDNLNLADVGRVAIEWGVDRYPAGASWERGVNREAIMIQFFFGDKVKNHHFYLPDSPYFIGVFLCRDDMVNSPFVGFSYRDTARYVCLGSPRTGETITSTIEIDNAFRQWFGRNEVPPVTAIGIEVDTTDLPDNGESLAYLKRVTLYKRNPVR